MKPQRVSHAEHGRGTVLLELSPSVSAVCFDRMGVFAISTMFLVPAGSSK